MASTTTRPDGTLSNSGWSFSGATLHGSLQAISDPTVPAATPKIFIPTSTGNAASAQMSLGDMPADFVSSTAIVLKAHLKITPGAGVPGSVIVTLLRSNGTTISSVNGSGGTDDAWFTAATFSTSTTKATLDASKVQIDGFDDFTICEIKSLYVSITYIATGGITKTITRSLTRGLTRTIV
jgi:hypothetical protein